MQLQDLEVYRLAREVSLDPWNIYKILSWEEKRVLGNQFIQAIDSIGANVAEGWGRFHFLDKNRFNYNARGSLMEAHHWIDLLIERELCVKETGIRLKDKLEVLHFKLNNYINSTRGQSTK